MEFLSILRDGAAAAAAATPSTAPGNLPRPGGRRASRWGVSVAVPTPAEVDTTQTSPPPAAVAVSESVLEESDVTHTNSCVSTTFHLYLLLRLFGLSTSGACMRSVSPLISNQTRMVRCPDQGKSESCTHKRWGVELRCSALIASQNGRQPSLLLVSAVQIHVGWGCRPKLTSRFGATTDGCLVSSANL